MDMMSVIVYTLAPLVMVVVIFLISVEIGKRKRKG